MSYRAVFAVREFRAVFAAHAMSTLGVIVSEIALSVLIYRLTGSPLLSALTFAFGLLPYVLGGTLLSSVADRFPARRVLVGCDLLCAACAAVMTVPGTPVALLLALRVVTAAVAPIFQGTRASTLGDILGEGDLFVLGRSVIRITGQSGQLAGFALGGLLLSVVSPRVVLMITVITFLGSALLLRFRTRRRPARAGTAGGGLVRDSISGMRLLFADRRIRSLLLLGWVPPMFAVVSEALLTPYADGLALAPGGLGVLMCGMPVGAILSETLVGSLLGPRGRARLTMPVAALALVPSLGYAFEPAFGWALVCQILTGCGIAYTLGLDLWFVAAVPEELRGRAMTLMTAGLMTAQGVGMALAGTLAELLPVHQVIAGGAALGVMCVAAVLWRTRAALPEALVRRSGL
ncbi:MFS transporter [Nonomuraea sp. NPDC050536]|uniref:MFS transporter n=1 Tax=Nonomuraea sp. NPDC050536 TaxID=3364366 RepID=UPI0037C56141